MPTHPVAAFFAGMFIANAVPHFVKGICGDRFPTPFAKPPGKGLSSPLVNAVWALANLLAGGALFRQADLASGNLATLLLAFAGVALITVFSSLHFAKKDPS